MLAIWSLVTLSFLNPAVTSGSSWLKYCWSLAWRILSITLLAYEMSAAAAAKLLQLCPTLCDPIDGSLPGSSVHGIFQSRIPEWVAISFSENECTCVVIWTFFSTALLWNGMKTNLFQSCGHCWVFQICWHIECSTLTAASFWIWNSQLEFHHLH